MDDLHVWNIGIEHLKCMLTNHSVSTRLELTQLLARYRDAKEAIDSVVTEVDSAHVCCECGGQCCLNGKYRVNVLDTMAFIFSKGKTPANFSRKPACPYGTDSGCAMRPALRPADCILFICEAIDQRLSLQARNFLAEQELGLRECICEASRLTGEQMGTSLLLWAEKIADKNN